MKPANFPARKASRQVGALDRFKMVLIDHPSNDAKLHELGRLQSAALAEQAARAVRTKKRRTS